MSPQKIEMYFKEIMHLSEKIHGLATRLKNMGGGELLQLVCENKTCWNSGCEEILAKGEVRISTRAVKEAESLLRLAGEMEEQAGKMYQAEMLNRQLAATRIYL